MSLFADPAERFAAELRLAEERLRAHGLGGRRAFVALVRHLAARLGIATELWPDGPDAPASARLESIPLSPDLDLFGLAYERFFTDLFKGKRGQYFTPRPLVELVTDFAQVRAGERVIDPTCGSGGFLVAAASRGADAEGIEVDPDLAALARLNLALHGASPRAVTVADFFASEPAEAYDVVLANPPFSVDIHRPDVLSRHGVRRARVTSDELFLRAAVRWVRAGGRVAVVVPWSLLTGPAYDDLRAFILAHFAREAVVSLPEGVFLPFGGTLTRAAVLVLRRLPARVSPTLCAVVSRPGYETTRRRFRRTEVDEIVALRLHLRGAPYARAARVHDPPWVPEEALAGNEGLGVPRFRVSERARVRSGGARRGSEAPATVLTLADVDASTGEFMHATVKSGHEVDGLVPVVEGELLFGRMRPELRNIAVAERPDDSLPTGLVASPEFVRVQAEKEPDFLLTALRSSFALPGLAATAGQTRPRARTDDIAALQLPDLPEALRAAFDAELGRVRRERRRLRQRLGDLERAYEAYGRGEIDAVALSRVLGESSS
ncbi:MAG: SAM-dependent DNA methyltransferase [Deltaproteobacteria bacterium]|nr:SAM-dependent DNA methyltransferase [Deltaproteobacteria bacterium]